MLPSAHLVASPHDNVLVFGNTLLSNVITLLCKSRDGVSVLTWLRVSETMVLCMFRESIVDVAVLW